MAIRVEDETYYTLQEISEMGLGNVQVLRRWANGGQIPANKVGKTYYVKGEWLKGWIEGRTKGGPDEQES